MTDDYRDALAEHLAAIAVELAGRVRDHGPDDNRAWLLQRLPDPGQWFQLAFVLAAAIPDDRSWSALTAWTRLPLERRYVEDDDEPAPRAPRLTDADVVRIRELRAAGMQTTDLAQQFGVTANYVGKIARGVKRAAA